ncbi:MAG: DUF4876 domain-containing protein [Prevotella sp.]|jgi:hypothetical protein|nr:DUF4876 domain-containing protein [Prevotella sp.]MCI1281833.1 DUF4876 domain-containing protein [Prevotella sp.]
MKHIINYFALLAVLLLSACVDYNDATQAVSVSVKVSTPAEYKDATAGLEGHTVTLIRKDGTQLTAVTDANGIAQFQNIVPDVYTISTSWDLTANEYTVLTGGNTANEGAVVAGNINSQLLTESTAASTLQLSTQLSINHSMVIGKVYYAGTKDNNNKSYLAGQFIELYNQSDKEISAAGLYIGLVESNSTPAYSLDQLHSEFADSVVLLKQLFRIPTSSKLTIKPGGSIVITNSAIDHTVNASNDPNLLTADLEAKDASGRTTNNPATEALDLVYTAYSAISKMNITQNGLTSVIIFRTDEDPTKWPRTYNYGKTKGSMWLEAPKHFIIDAVEILKYKTEGVDLATKRLYDELDAGYAVINSISGYNGEMIYRKTSTRRGADGHKILQDTNNSTNDFHTTTTLTIREYDD